MKTTELTTEERLFLQIIHSTPRKQLEELFLKLGILDSFQKTDKETI